ncbi:methionine aminopeptidase [Sporocytophaga myxococcoides]|uniref:Methionine aminopeptidase n=1 Tax=Sporocytophaga myxococcoides TaxID=153721 RepID=A0A098LAY6_9BACT|nr:type I methionyl aminopeptidase [Sporocytophaga myxococcoides]GAL84121.1 methionine aminopeptidase [Sporocytophaga myxococcoides]
MIYYKTEEEIDLIKKSGDLLGRVHGEIAKAIKIGVTTQELDDLAYNFIISGGGVPSFKGYNGFPYTLCISVNEQVVHGFPGKYALKEGDVISVDCGVNLGGYHSDSAYTYGIGKVSEDVRQLLEFTKQSLYLGIEEAVVGKRTGDIGFSIQNFVESKGYSVVRELVGHGVGKKLHEGPEVPNYGKRGKGVKLEEGMVIAIEPMINLGKKEIVQEEDGWTIRTKDRKPSAHFEHTVAIRKGKAEVLTTFKYIEEVI